VSPLPAAVDLRSQRGDRAALVLIADPARSPSRDLQDALQSLFGLSSAEARIAFLIARGETVANAAALQHVTEATARAQLKAVFAKMSLSRQSELVATVLKLASTHSNGDTASSN
jgi:DNA-binding CsgD family transcriptional regulator